MVVVTNLRVVSSEFIVVIMEIIVVSFEFFIL